jgi:hydroxymethylpyrimidine pyrophosphatase-like HAD family hydrolase
LKVEALFADYDGTIAPLGVPRDESRILQEVEAQLRYLSKRIPVCIITSKDFDFIHPRSEFATGWACVSGLDLRLADGRRWTENNLKDLSKVLRLAESKEIEGASIELKKGPGDELLGMAIDWTTVPNASESMVESLTWISGEGVAVLHDRASTFVDFYAAPPDKGKALKDLKRLLGVEGNTMFIGDSPADNGAFQQASVGVGVSHGQALEELQCGFVVEQVRLGEFLRSLADRRMDFAPDMAGLRPQGREGP